MSNSATPTLPRRLLLRGVSLTALLAASPSAHAGGQFRSLAQALSLASHTAIASAASGGGYAAARTAGLGAANLARAAASFSRFRNLAEAIAAGAGAPGVTDGVSARGLQPASGIAADPGLWVGADTAIASAPDGRRPGFVDVTVTQTKPVAALTWKNFSVGPHTDLIFNQSAGGAQQSSWVVINTLQDPNADPSAILGEITAPGKVYVINRNGVAFGSGSVVNVGALVASTASIAQSQFGTAANGDLTFNLYGSVTGTAFASTFAGGLPTAVVTVAPGASITTPAPSGATGGGYVMLLGGAVSNQGVIATPQGQTILAAGTDFQLRQGYSAAGNEIATTLGSEIAVSHGGTASNSGVIVADQGDITMVGHLVSQSGVFLATTTVDLRGTVHLLTDDADTTAQVVLAPGSVTEILPEDNGKTALDSQRAAATYNAARLSPVGPQLNDFNTLSDQLQQSRIEISTGGTVDVQNGALAIAQGGQVAIAGGQSIVLESGSVVDVSGTDTAVLPASMNALQINIQQYQLRDSAGNRTGPTQSSNVYVDARQLVEIASGAYAGFVYTPGGLLEVSGYLGLVPHGILEWTALGGEVTLQGLGPTANAGSVAGGGSVLVQPGAEINLTGGLVHYAPGMVAQSYLIGPGGKLYNANTAPGDLIYSGVYSGIVVDHARWHVIDHYYNPVFTPAALPSPGYAVGRDAGSLTIDAASVMVQGEVAAGVSYGQYQIGGRPPNVTDPFLLAQSVVPEAGALLIGNYVGGTLSSNGLPGNVSFGNLTATDAGGAGAAPTSLTGTVAIDSTAFDAAGFATLTVATSGSIGIDAPITVADGGAITLSGHAIADNASITAHGGSILLTNLLPAANGEAAPGPGTITVSQGSTLSTRGVWTNAVLDRVHIAGEALANGGSITIDSTGGLTLASSSTLDASSGGAWLLGGKLLAASGGSISLTADLEPVFGAGAGGPPNTHFAPVQVFARLLGHGFTQGGALAITVPEVRIGGSDAGVVDDFVRLDASFFQAGFRSYSLNGFLGATVAPGEQVQVIEPVYTEGSHAPAVPTGGDPASAYNLAVLPLYIPNGGRDSFSQRPGASLSLSSNIDPTVYDGGGGTVTVGAGAEISVDPGQSITLSGYGQVSVFGTLTAHSGAISISNTRGEQADATSPTPSNYLPGLSVWLGATSRLDVSGVPALFTDPRGRAFGEAGNGGAIELGAPPAADAAQGLSTYAEVVEVPGAVLDLSGAAATVGVIPGAAIGSILANPAPLILPGNGGTLAARSYSGIALDGIVQAHGSGAGAAGGMLSLQLDTLPGPNGNGVLTGLPTSFYDNDQLIVSQAPEPTVADPALKPGDALPLDAIATAHISEAQIEAAGFDDLFFQAPVAIAFDGTVQLSAGRAITLSAPALGETSRLSSASASVSAPYVSLLGDPVAPLRTTLDPAIAFARLTVSADLIDIANNIDLGTEATNQTATTVNGTSTASTFTSAVGGFNSATFDSSSDIRFNGKALSGAVTLDSSGNITFSAAQLYPVTGADFSVQAGDQQTATQGFPEFIGTITVLRNAHAAPVPFSVGGTLALIGYTVLQDGILRAPEGEIRLGAGDLVRNEGVPPYASGTVIIGAGSVTSVSLDGISVPYGGTADGVNYDFAGSPVGIFNPRVVLAAQNIAVVPGSQDVRGAEIDLSGGGQLTGSAFIFGRGGSVDVNTTALISSATGTVNTASSNSVFAIVPGYASAYAPVSPGDAGYSVPGIGEQVTVAAGVVPGLAAGTYTLLPAYYDQLSGAYRVELAASPIAATFANSVGNFTTLAGVRIGTANTGVLAGAPTAALFTSAAGVQQLAQYDTESYGAFETAQAARFNSPRPPLPQDAKTLAIDLDAIYGRVGPLGQAQTSSLSIGAGTVADTPASGGYGATVEIESPMPLEVVPQTGDPGVPVVSNSGSVVPYATVSAPQLDVLQVPRLVIGGTLSISSDTITVFGYTPEVLVLRNSDLTAGDVILTAGEVAGSSFINVASFSTISTIGQPASAPGLGQGFVFTTQNGFTGSFGGAPVIDVSNAQDVFVPSSATATASVLIASSATLLAGSSLDFVAPRGVSFEIGEADLGGRYVDLQAAAINLGSLPSLAADAALLPAGFDLTSSTLATLLDGDPAAGVPAAQQLILTATQGVNLLGGGTLTLDTGSTALVLNTPAIYGYGSAADAVNITAKSFTWSGLSNFETLGDNVTTLTVSTVPGGPIAGSSAATAIGSLSIEAGQIVLGYGPLSQPNDQVLLDRLLAGFDAVTLAGSTSVSANNQSSLAVYQTVPVEGQPGTGGSLTLDTPLLTTASGAVLRLTTAGPFALSNTFGTTANTANVATLGGEITIDAQSVSLDSAIALPGGRLGITADGSLTNTVSTTSTPTVSGGETLVSTTVTGTIAGASIDLLSGAVLDLSGRSTPIFNQTAQSPGGTISLESASGIVTSTTTTTTTISGSGSAKSSVSFSSTIASTVPNPDLSQGDSIAIAAGSRLDVSAPGAAAGGITLSALGGTVDAAGSLSGGAPGADAPGSFSLLAGGFGTATSFDGLNALLDAGGIFGARSFELAQGNILIDRTVKARTVQVSADGGTLEVSGTIDASGATPGSIRLSAGDDLTLDSTALLDAHATGFARDSYGEGIDAENRAHITLTASAGTLTLANGTQFDLRYDTAAAMAMPALGQLVLNAPRTANGVQAVANGSLSVLGAASIDLFAFHTYIPGDPNGTIEQAPGVKGAVTIQQIAADDTSWASSLTSNVTALDAQLHGLIGYGASFNLEPGVQIESASPNGNLTISGDLDLSGLRISDPAGFGNAINPMVIGSGEPGSLVFRASNDLVVNGSVTDGFAPPPDETEKVVLPGDNGWVFTGRVDTLSADILLPVTSFGVDSAGARTSVLELGPGTTFSTIRPISLNYSVTIAETETLPNVNIPFPVVVGGITQPIPAAGWIATAPVMRGGLVLFPKGALIPGGFKFQAGDGLGAGTILPFGFFVAQGSVVPAGSSLSIFAGSTVTLSASTGALPANAFIPSGTSAVFEGVFSGQNTPQKLTALDYRAQNAAGVQGYLYPLAQMLPAGDQSWSLDFTAGANLGSANASAVLPATLVNSDGLAGPPNTINQAPGSLLIDDQHYATPSTNITLAVPAFSVIRTGTGDLSLQAGGSIDQSSLYGIYTAGTQDPLPGDENAQFNSPRTTYCGVSVCGVLPDNKQDTSTVITLNALLASNTGSYQAYYPTGGGDVSVLAQGNITGDVLGQSHASSGIAGGLSSDLVGNWLWRQGTTGTSAQNQPTAWWINFGTYVAPLDSSASNAGNTSGFPPQLTGFQGIGALGGGNVTVVAGGEVGQSTFRDGFYSSPIVRGEGLIVAVGGTGRLLPGSSAPITTGGGTLTLLVGGTINPLDESSYAIGATPLSLNPGSETGTNGDLIDLRGAISVSAGAVGRIDTLYTPINTNDPRPLDPFAVQDGVQNGGVSVIPGDATVSIDTMRDLVLAGVGDPGREPVQGVTESGAGPTQLTSIFTGFSLWTADTSIGLFSEGGNTTPSTIPENLNTVFTQDITNISPTDYRSIYPSVLNVTAATGSILYGQPGSQAFSQHLNGSGGDPTTYSLETAPAPDGQVAFLAGGSINANGYVIDISGANPADLPLPNDPAFTASQVTGKKTLAISNIRGGAGTNHSPLALFAFEPDTPTTDLHANDPTPAMFYAASGDIINFQTGEILNFGTLDPISPWYIAAKPVWIMAGQDIVSSGVRPQLSYSRSNEENLVYDDAFGSNGGSITSSGNLFLNPGSSISVVSAGRDILSGYFYVGGSGLLEVDAGRNIYQGDATSPVPGTTATVQTLAYGDIKSLGSLIQGAPISLTDGSNIALLAGIGAGPDYTAFASLYFNPANQANLALPLTDPANRGKVQQDYAAQLTTMLAAEYGYKGDAAGALAFFDTLPAVDQAVLVRAVFYQEILASGRQYNDPTSLFFRSYARGRLAIDTLFPSSGPESTPGVPAGYSGAITMLSGNVYVGVAGQQMPIADSNGTPVNFDAGVATLFGGGVQVLDPGGPVLLGAPATPVGGNSGIVTYGSGDIDIFSLGSVLLGQSRIFTTLGGNILIWSAEGDINAGIGAKTSITFNPPLTVYDDTGGITITPPASSSGAGIATLQSLANVPPGNIDLIAPLGVIDAGEAGIRVSGNLNLAALTLLNTANIQVKGTTTGVPTVTTASLGAVEAAAGAAGAAVNAAQSVTQNRNSALGETASVLDVEVISIGGTYEEDQKRKKGL